MPANPGFQLSLDVKGRTCLVLGGGDEAAEKAQRLLEAGAKVTVISPTLNDTLRKLTASAKVLHRGRLFRATDTEGVILVINTLRGDPDFSKSLLELAKKERFLLWSMDQPEWSTVSMPAVVSRGHLRLAISTSGAAPALASRLRQDLEELFGEECVAFLEWLADLRDETKVTEQDSEKRRTLLREAVNGFKLNGSIEFPKAWLEERAKQKA
ncbi:MAG TPA: bifunctional precorrin-2 dehydrogenase/sirohydrochlorin ferrochelatase [Nitrospiraceae bacterium]|nr:bifunctional precorrin-2 dehydrogenase/sirohydrochlorin ferrochelatase [Nitrospiraceae bacterium]